MRVSVSVSVSVRVRVRVRVRVSVVSLSGPYSVIIVSLSCHCLSFLRRFSALVSLECPCRAIRVSVSVSVRGSGGQGVTVSGGQCQCQCQGYWVIVSSTELERSHSLIVFTIEEDRRNGHSVSCDSKIPSQAAGGLCAIAVFEMQRFILNVTVASPVRL